MLVGSKAIKTTARRGRRVSKVLTFFEMLLSCSSSSSMLFIVVTVLLPLLSEGCSRNFDNWIARNQVYLVHIPLHILCQLAPCRYVTLLLLPRARTPTVLLISPGWRTSTRRPGCARTSWPSAQEEEASSPPRRGSAAPTWRTCGWRRREGCWTGYGTLGQSGA